MAGVTRIPSGNFGAWTAYTPTWTQGVAISKTVNYARYVQIGKLVVVQVQMTATSGGTAGQGFSVSTPVNQNNVSNASVCGVASYVDVTPGFATYVLSAVAGGAGSIQFYHDTSAANIFGIVPGVTVTSGEILSFQLSYEAA